VNYMSGCGTKQIWPNLRITSPSTTNKRTSPLPNQVAVIFFGAQVIVAKGYL